MSYILDALRRADAERQRGAVPGLNAHPAPAPQADAAPPDRGLPWAGVLAGLALLVAIAVAAWLAGRSDSPGAVPTVAVPAPPVAAVPAPAAPVTTTPTPAPAVVPTTPTTVTAPLATGPTTVTVTVTGPTVVPASPPARSTGPRAAPASSPPAASVAPSAASAPGPADRAVPAGRVPSLAEMPDSLRQQLPPLVLGGGVYSEQAAQRLVIVNGQVTHEGDQPAAGLRVLQIRPRSVVFSFRGQLFEVGL